MATAGVYLLVCYDPAHREGVRQLREARNLQLSLLQGRQRLRNDKTRFRRTPRP